MAKKNLTSNKPRRLPNGNYTQSLDYYLQSWRKVAQPICKKTGWSLTAFDPNFQFTNKAGLSISLPLWAVEDLISSLYEELYV